MLGSLLDVSDTLICIKVPLLVRRKPRIGNWVCLMLKLIFFSAQTGATSFLFLLLLLSFLLLSSSSSVMIIVCFFISEESLSPLRSRDWISPLGVSHASRLA